MENNKKIAVIYHRDCEDGFGAAWVVWKKFGNKADYFPMFYQSGFPNGLKKKEIYMVDFSYPPKELEEIKKNNEKVIVIDHHKTAEESFKKADGGLFDLKHSGATLTWKYFFPNKKVPLLLEYIEDRDLWIFKKKNSKELLAYLSTLNFDFRVFDKAAKDFEFSEKRKVFLEKGKSILKHDQKMIEEIFKSGVEEVIFEGKKIFAVNSPVFVSELGKILYTKKPHMAIIWHKTNDGRIKVSLRSDGKVDVGEIAKKLSKGGGGHRGAAGFVLEKGMSFPWKSINS
ncbi:MAG: DHHA1 domain-containing protein [Candidatus Pacebacteria bacterium]|nr:DHHA1 domain-containing protein [Candidatus Paceibacterota bacterium]